MGYFGLIEITFIFKSAKCNPASIIELARKIFHEISTYVKIMVSDTSSPGKRFTNHRWTPPPQRWLKYNTNTSKNIKNNKTAISFVCRDATGKIITKVGTVIGDIPILVTEIMTIREAAKHAIQHNRSRVIIESDSVIII